MTKLEDFMYLVSSGPCTVTVGDYGTAIALEGVAVAGKHGHARSGYRGHSQTGDFGVAVSGERGSAVAGDFGVAAVGPDGEASCGRYGKATAGVCGIVKGEEGSLLAIGNAQGVVGDNLSPNTFYCLNQTRDKLVKHQSECGLSQPKV